MSSSDASNFRVIADQFGLIQHVAGPTHRGGGWLDVIITRDDCVPTDLCIHPPTDHGIVEITIPFLHDAPSYHARQVRGWRNLDREAFRSALLDVPAIVDPSILDDLLVADIFSIYKATMAGLIDRFLPAHPPRFVDAPSPRGSMLSVAHSGARLADMRGNTDTLS